MTDKELRRHIKRLFEQPEIPFEVFFNRQKAERIDNMKTYYNLGTEEVFLTTGIYMTTLNTSVNATCTNGEPYATLTVNIEELDDPELAYLNVNFLGLNVEEFFIQNELAVKIEGKEKQENHVVYPLYRLNLKKIWGEE